MTSTPTLTERFRDLHRDAAPLVVPNPWDVGSAVLFEQLGFLALATTSSGHAVSLGRHDGQLTRDESLDHAARLVRATALPVTADLESGFGRDAGEVAETYARAARAGLAGASIEDATGDADHPIRELAEAADRVRAAAEAAHVTGAGLVLTARAENYIHGRADLADTIARLQAYQEAGADVLYAPGLTDADDIRAVVTSVDRPVNVLLRPNGPSVAELGELGVARVSVGGALAYAAYGAAAQAAHCERSKICASAPGSADFRPFVRGRWCVSIPSPGERSKICVSARRWCRFPTFRGFGWDSGAT